MQFLFNRFFRTKSSTHWISLCTYTSICFDVVDEALNACNVHFIRRLLESYVKMSRDRGILRGVVFLRPYVPTFVFFFVIQINNDPWLHVCFIVNFESFFFQNDNLCLLFMISISVMCFWVLHNCKVVFLSLQWVEWVSYMYFDFDNKTDIFLQNPVSCSLVTVTLSIV